MTEIKAHQLIEHQSIEHTPAGHESYGMVVFSNKIFKIKCPLPIFIQEYGVDPKKTI